VLCGGARTGGRRWRSKTYVKPAAGSTPPHSVHIGVRSGRPQLQGVVVGHYAEEYDSADPVIVEEGDEAVFGYLIVDQKLLKEQ